MRIVFGDFEDSRSRHEMRFVCFSVQSNCILLGDATFADCTSTYAGYFLSCSDGRAPKVLFVFPTCPVGIIEQSGEIG